VTESLFFQYTADIYQFFKSISSSIFPIAFDDFIRMSHHVKVVFLGNHGVGKTAILDQAKTGRLSGGPSTIGASSVSLKVHVQGTDIEFQVWDTAGQEKYRTLVPLYCRGASIAILVFSLEDVNSFNDLPGWVHDLQVEAPNCELYLVGSKSDLVQSRVITQQQGESKAAEIGAIFYIETSAVTGEGVSELFSRIGDNVIRFPPADIEVIPEAPQEAQSQSWWGWISWC
jgi:small GTP-binding protein